MEEFEELRLKLRKNYIIGAIITIIVAVLSAFLNFVLIFLSIFFGIIITTLSSAKLQREYARIFKKVFVVKALESKFTDLIYEPNKGMPYSTIANTNMMYMGDRYYSEDFISAKYKDIKFEQADVHIEEEHTTTDSDGHTSTTYVTIFQGRWMVFDFNKTFKADVQIAQKGFGNSKVKTMSFLVKKDDLFKKVSMESESFNKKFNVYAQNEHDAFYIITPSLMDRIEKLDEINIGKLLFCFVDNRLHIGIYDGKNSFEPDNVFKKINEEEINNRILGDISMITQFIDELNLDNDLFKKEV